MSLVRIDNFKSLEDNLGSIHMELRYNYFIGLAQPDSGPTRYRLNPLARIANLRYDTKNREWELFGYKNGRRVVEGECDKGKSEGGDWGAENNIRSLWCWKRLRIDAKIVRNQSSKASS